MGFAGTPPAIQYFATTEPAATVEPLPTTAPDNRTTFIPIQTSSSTITSLSNYSWFFRLGNFYKISTKITAWFPVATFMPSIEKSNPPKRDSVALFYSFFIFIVKPFN